MIILKSGFECAINHDYIKDYCCDLPLVASGRLLKTANVMHDQHR